MRRSVSQLRNRLLVIAGVLVLSLWSIYPPQERIKLGLDLDGGAHLVLRVHTDDALRVRTQAEIERLREALTESNVRFTSVHATSPTEFVASGIQDEMAFKSVLAAAESEFDRASNGTDSLFRMRPAAIAQLRNETVEQAIEIIDRRANELGVTESVVARYTGQDRILVELPGVSDVQRAKQIIQSTAQLRLTLVDRGPFTSHEEALAAYGGTLPLDLEVLASPPHTEGSTENGFYAVRRAAAVTGSDLRTARSSLDEFNRPAVAFTLAPRAAERFGAVTEQNIGRPLATVLDGRVMSVATINSRIDREGQIVGVSREEMLEQVINLRSGALPASLEYLEEQAIGASLGRASVRAGVLASLAGLGLVALFMVAYYKGTGLNALVSITVNLLILLGLMAYIPVTLTLPGIAGLILTIGMGVDSNVLIFERLKEELAAGRVARSAVNASFERVTITIVDTHVASLIAAAVLFQFGTSPIRGFATTLAIGLVANVFTAVFVSRTMFMLLLRRGPSASRPLSIRWPLPRVINANVDFARWRWHAMALSLVLIAAGAGTIMSKGLRLGIDFSGGTLMVVEFPDGGATEESVRAAVASLPGDEVVQRYGAAGDGQFLIRRPLSSAATPGNLEDAARQVIQALDTAHLPPFEVGKRELVSAAIGEDLQRRGIYATMASVLAITAYIAWRFRPSFAIGGIAATVHDLLVTLSCLAVAGYDLSLTITAALLTITGYSVNDTIVVFDRVREHLKAAPRQPLEALVNLSVNQTLSRTIITAGTTFLAALALFLFGGEALEGFAFTMLIGVACGTYSTVFIASAIASALHR